MTEPGKGAVPGDTRARLLEAAAELIAASPGQDVPLRAICDRVGVKLPTLYHFFGSKSGLLDAVVEHGFDRYLEVKGGQQGGGDPIEDIRRGWDAHVAFGLDNPGFYALMYGQVTPGSRPEAQRRPTELLRALTARAGEQGRLVVDPDQAADHILAANVGLTLHLILQGAPDEELSIAMREAVLDAVTGAAGASGSATNDGAAAAAAHLLAVVGGPDVELDGPELALLRKWLRQLADR